MVIIDPSTEWQVTKESLLYKCGWSPMEGETFHSRIVTTFVNGEIVYDKGQVFSDVRAAMALRFIG
jgi:dihydroorotase